MLICLKLQIKMKMEWTQKILALAKTKEKKLSRDGKKLILF